MKFTINLFNLLILQHIFLSNTLQRKHFFSVKRFNSLMLPVQKLKFRDHAMQKNVFGCNVQMSLLKINYYYLQFYLHFSVCDCSFCLLYVILKVRFCTCSSLLVLFSAFRADAVEETTQETKVP